MYSQAQEDTLNSFHSQAHLSNTCLISQRWNALWQKWKTVKIISKGHSFHHINQKTGQASKRPKWGHITRATTITTNNNTRHINHKRRKRVIKQVNFNIDISELHKKAGKFQGVNLRNNFLAWRNIASDTFILNIVQQRSNAKIYRGHYANVPFEYKRTQLEQSIIDEEVRKLIQTKMVITTYAQEEDFISNLFIRSIKDGSYRTILKLKKNKSRLWNHSF